MRDAFEFSPATFLRRHDRKLEALSRRQRRQISGQLLYDKRREDRYVEVFACFQCATEIDRNTDGQSLSDRSVFNCDEKGRGIPLNKNIVLVKHSTVKISRPPGLKNPWTAVVISLGRSVT